ncbi:MAG: protein-disulfide reductase DsbD family protein [Oceanococcaceae bacterium]
MTSVARAQAPEPVLAELFLEHGQVPAGHSLTVGVRLTPDPGWHTYWLNPGDAGRATNAVFSGLPGLQAEQLGWPTPHALREDPLVTYGYSEAHTLLYTLHIPEQAEAFELQVDVDWLVCKDICIPGSAQLTDFVDIGPLDAARNLDVFSAAKTVMPSPASGEPGQFEVVDGALRMAWPQGQSGPVQVFPAASYLVDHAATPLWAEDGSRLSWPLAFADAQAPEVLEAVIVDDAGARWMRFAPGAVAAVELAGVAEPHENKLPLWQAFVFAFFGGLLLNLMPCVFPVLAMKGMGLARGDNLAQKRREAIVYTLGVLFSFVGLAAVLMALRAAGAALGWGFQLQNPAVVGALAVLFGFLGLGLAGWTQIGVGWMGWGQDLTQGHGDRAAFFTGVLAVVVASPCTAPFMGAALGFAITQPPLVGLGIFASLGLGLAAPILLLAGVPTLARRLPRPGPWMDTFKWIMALLFFGAAAWLLWVVWAQAGLLAGAMAVLALGLVALVTRQGAQGPWIGLASLRAGLLLLAAALILSPALLPPAEARLAGDWQPWSADRVAAAQAEGRVVFVDFTADWCISCLVNERTALADDAVQAALRDKQVLLLKADWTRQDPAITAGLAEFGRNGVPLYLLYDGRGGVEVLPQLLTAGIVLEALEAL